MDRKKIFIISLIALVVVIIFLIIFLFIFKPQTPEGDQIEEDQEVIIDETYLNQIDELPPPSVETVTEEASYPLGLKQLAFSFTERFGTYSSHSNFKGLQDVKSLATVSMQRYIDTLISQSEFNSPDYQGYSTKALSGDLLEFDDDRAEILVKTQRLYESETEEKNIFYQDLLLRFLKVDNEWKVNEAYWR